jgi:hypothetical protein
MFLRFYELSLGCALKQKTVDGAIVLEVAADRKPAQLSSDDATPARLSSYVSKALGGPPHRVRRSNKAFVDQSEANKRLTSGNGSGASGSKEFARVPGDEERFLPEELRYR